MTHRAFWSLAVLAFASALSAAELEVTGIQAAHRHGQTFVTWRDVAEGEEGASYRYSLYRSEQPITADNLAQAELCYHGVLNNSAKQFGYAFNAKDRLDPTKPYAIIEAGGQQLPAWSGLAVHTAAKPAKAFYAIVATDEKLQPMSAIVPGQSATTQALEEQPGEIQPIKILDSKDRKTYVAQTSITGQQGLPLAINLHGSQGAGGPGGEWGDYYLYFGTAEMGYRDGLPGLFTVQENRAKEGNSLLLRPRDAIEHPNGRGAFETMWLGYSCITQPARFDSPRYYRFTENRLVWMIDWVIKRYDGDATRTSMGGSSMGGLGSINVGFRHPERFVAVYPATAPFLWWRPSSLVNNPNSDPRTTVMADNVTTYADYTNSPKFAAGQHGDMPFLGWACGRRDPNHHWQEYVDMVQALTANHHGFAFAWNDGGHSEGARPMNQITKYYPAAKFARNVSYPAFGNSSINSKLGSGSPEEGDREGGVNLGFDWKNVTDEEHQWSATISNDLCQDTMTVGVTPRRCQKFRPQPGAELQWTTTHGGSGMATADQWGLVTVPRVVIKQGAATTVTLQSRP